MRYKKAVLRFETINFGSGSDFPVDYGSGSGLGSDFQIKSDPDPDSTFYIFTDPDPFWILFGSDIFFYMKKFLFKKFLKVFFFQHSE